MIDDEACILSDCEKVKGFKVPTTSTRLTFRRRSIFIFLGSAPHAPYHHHVEKHLSVLVGITLQ